MQLCFLCGFGAQLHVKGKEEMGNVGYAEKKTGDAIDLGIQVGINLKHGSFFLCYCCIFFICFVSLSYRADVSPPSAAHQRVC